MHNASRLPFVRRLAFGAAIACASLSPALAQQPMADDERSWVERRVDGLESGLSFFGTGRGEDRPAAPRNVQTAQSSSLADIAVRLDRLENQMRQLNGRIDEMQFQTRRNDEALKKFQGDVDFRFQELGGSGGGSTSAKPGKRSDAGGGSGAGSGAGAPPASLGDSRGSGGDQIGGLIDEPNDDPNGPMSIRPPGARQDTVRRSEPGGSTYGGTTGAVARGGVSVGTGNPRDQFDMGVGFVQRRDYEQAETTFRDFLRANPNDRMAGDAEYWLGESLYQRRQYKDAAESFLKVATEKPQSSKAPESLMKLGLSLNGMGEKEAACATFSEAAKKYARIKAQVEREQRRVSC